jgi:adenylate cyclase
MNDDTLSHALADWLMQAALTGADMQNLVNGAVNRELGGGVPLLRAHVTFRTLHPSFESVSLIWRRGRGVSSQEFVHGSGTLEAWQRSPFVFMVQNGIKYLRRPLSGDTALLDFPILSDLADEGATDYFAVVIPFDSRDIGTVGNRPDGIATSWVTDRAGGFADSHIAALLHLVPRLAVACKLAIREQIAKNVAVAYLGKSAGEQVLNGHIRLGDYETINAVVWNADLRDSTGRLERLGVERYLSLLNGFLECAAGAVQSYGGEILAYPGDAVLAIFRHDDEKHAGLSALSAAAEFRRRLHDVNANLAEIGAETLRAGLGIHRGQLAFGNIGTGGRQTFTAIGPAVNVVNRLEAMTKAVQYPVVVSNVVADQLTAAELTLHPLGSHEIRGSEYPIEIFGATDADLLPYRAPTGYAEVILAPEMAQLQTA